MGERYLTHSRSNIQTLAKRQFQKSPHCRVSSNLEMPRNNLLNILNHHKIIDENLFLVQAAEFLFRLYSPQPQKPRSLREFHLEHIHCAVLILLSKLGTRGALNGETVPLEGMKK